MISSKGKEHFKCVNPECKFEWNEYYSLDNYPRPDEEASGDICPKCNTFQKNDNENEEQYEREEDHQM